MTKVEFIARVEKRVRPYFVKLNPELVSCIYSPARKIFINLLSKENPKKIFVQAENKHLTLWDLEFSSNIFNAAGMFKYGEAYYTVASQGAGAYLSGTTTALPRRGNSKRGITHPFIPYTFSNSASNWMGLPNKGNLYVAKQLSKLEKQKGCPIGASLSLSPEQSFEESLKGLLEGICDYEKAGVDFIEINESCPNVEHSNDIDNETGLDKSLIQRIQWLSDDFLKKRNRNLPTIIKLSNDTDIELIPKMIDILIDAGFDGLNLGNTSSNYDYYINKINSEDLKNYLYFTSNFGGGISGAILKETSLELATAASKYLSTLNLKKEFHIIRTGGIENLKDLKASDNAGISLNQWFTGYFENFAKYGHRVYKKLLS